MTSPVAVNNYGISVGTASTGVFIAVLASRNPTVNDINYPVQKRWINTDTGDEYILKGFNSFSGVTTANWLLLAQSGSGGLTINYTNVTAAMSPYTVLSTDNYLSVNCSAGAVTLNFPNSPTDEQVWVVKDRTGNAASNNITITTPGGTVTFDGATSYVMSTNYQSIQLIANSTPTYEVY
jgi:hypothetical protein